MYKRLPLIFRYFISILLDLSDVVTRYKQPTILIPTDAVKYRALIRWGDGETTLALGRSTNFQCADRSLARELRNLIYNESSELILCFPRPLLMRQPFRGTNCRFRALWAATAIMMRCSKRVRRYPSSDALMFRRDQHQDGISALFEALKSARRIIIVSPDLSYRLLLTKSCTFKENDVVIDHISVPIKDAYEYRNDLLNEILNHEPPDVILLSAGPVGKCLIPELLIRCPVHTKLVDTGHLFNHLEEVGERI